MFSGKSGAARLSIAVIIGLILVKVIVGAATGSLSILAQAIDSFLDLFAVAVTFVAIRIAARPADTDHPFGHGKAENIGAIIQAMLIFLAGGSIIYSAIRRIIAGGTPEMSDAGIGVMVISIIASILLSRYLLRAARREDSVALEANARNIAADVYSAAAVLAGLVVVRFTGWTIIDPILALLVAGFILKVAWDVLRHGFSGLVDVKLPEEEEATIHAAIREHFGGTIVNYHALRTRKAGSQRYIDLHLVMPRNTSVAEAHKVCDRLEEAIETRLANADVTIHMEPCDGNCEECDAECDGGNK